MSITLLPFREADLGLPSTSHGCSAHVIHRAYLIRALYDGLSEADRSRVLTNKVVTDITTDESGVTVRCADGTRHDGSVVVGADGTHSVVRRHMRTLALQAAPSAAAADVDEEEPFVSEYRMMWCSFPSQGEGEEHGGAGAAQDTHGDGRSVQFLTGGTRSWMFVYEQLPAPTRDRARYTADDVAAYAEKWGDLPVDSEGLRVRDMFAQRHHAGMTNLEEGVLRRWSWGGRLVLAGDAAHKFTPNAGLGYNNGIQDAAALTNELYRALHPSPYSDEKADEKRSSNNAAAAAAGPSAEVLGAAFERYQAVRRAAVESDFSASAFHTRTDAWRTTLHWLWDQWVLPRVPERLMLWVVRRLVGGSVARGVALDFLGGEEPFVGSIPWAHPIGGKSGSPSGGS